jgi:hypothetical protein
VVRHFALNLVRHVADKRSIKRRRKCAAWDPKYLLEILGPRPCSPRLVALTVVQMFGIARGFCRSGAFKPWAILVRSHEGKAACE